MFFIAVFTFFCAALLLAAMTPLAGWRRLVPPLFALGIGYAAVELPNHVPEQVKEQRRDVLMQVQQQIAFDWNAHQMGTTQAMMLDSTLEGQPNVFIARTIADAPDVDGIAFVTGDDAHRVGQIVECEVITSQGYDLIAAAIGEGR